MIHIYIFIDDTHLYIIIDDTHLYIIIDDTHLYIIIDDTHLYIIIDDTHLYIIIDDTHLYIIIDDTHLYIIIDDTHLYIIIDDTHLYIIIDDTHLYVIIDDIFDIGLYILLLQKAATVVQKWGFCSKMDTRLLGQNFRISPAIWNPQAKTSLWAYLSRFLRWWMDDPRGALTEIFSTQGFKGHRCPSFSTSKSCTYLRNDGIWGLWLGLTTPNVAFNGVWGRS